MIRVLVDGRVTGHDGIGRYTACLTAALREMPGPDLDVTILNATGTPRYSRAEGAELVQAARNAGADLIHVLDYRIPIEPLSVPIVATVHDVLRLDQRHCYANDQFAVRFGHQGLSRLREAVHALRRLRRPGAPAAIAYDSLHAEFYARMLHWTCQRACRIVTPAKAVAEQAVSNLGGETSVKGCLPSGLSEFCILCWVVPGLGLLLRVSSSSHRTGLSAAGNVCGRPVSRRPPTKRDWCQLTFNALSSSRK